MDLNELIPAPNAQKVNKLAKRVFGYSLDLENITENKAKKLQKNLNEQVKIYETKLGSKAQTSKKYYEMKLALEALSKHLSERMVDEEDVEEANAFNTARDKAIADGKDSFSFNGKTYKITNKGADDEKRAKDRFGEAEEELEEGPGESDLHHMDFDKVDRADLNTMSEIVAEYVNENMQDLPQSAAYSYDVIIDVDMNEDVQESVQVNEGQVEASELVMAAKSMVDKYDQIIKDISEMANEDLAPVADKVRDEMGSDVADNFTQQMTSALESTLSILKNDRATAENATRVLVGDQPADTMGDDALTPDVPDMEPTVDQDAEDDFAASDAAMGGEEAEVGREKRD